MLLGSSAPLPPPEEIYWYFRLWDDEEDKLFFLEWLIVNDSHSADKYVIISLIENEIFAVVVKSDWKTDSNLIVNNRFNLIVKAE